MSNAVLIDSSFEMVMNWGVDGLDQIEIDRGPKETKSLKQCETVLQDELHGESSQLGPRSLGSVWRYRDGSAAE